MRSGLLAIAILLAACTTHRAAPAMTQSPFSSIRHASPEAAARAYFTGADHCDLAALRSAFHPAAHLWWVDGTAHARAMLAWHQAIAAQAPCIPALDRTLTVLDREGAMALVEATARYATHRFHDLLLLADTPYGWLIVDKAFARLAPDASPALADSADVRAALTTKIEAAYQHSAALLAASHLDDAIYSRVHANDIAYARESVSEWAARYALDLERGADGRAGRWSILAVHASATIAAAKLDTVSPHGRTIDHVLLVRAPDGWKIAAATWGHVPH